MKNKGTSEAFHLTKKDTLSKLIMAGKDLSSLNFLFCNGCFVFYGKTD
uniref:Uncharacterized protein n=1 Tax=Anguilla anguilla TaxID=7936 RepID=A0A0E9WU20_ANGAN